MCYFLCTTFFRRAQWPRGLRRGSVAARMLEFRVRIPPRAWVSFVTCVFSGTGLCDGPITHPAECGVSECAVETLPEMWLGPTWTVEP